MVYEREKERYDRQIEIELYLIVISYAYTWVWTNSIFSFVDRDLCHFILTRSSFS